MNKERIDVRVEPELLEELDAISERQGLGSRSAAIREAIASYVIDNKDGWNSTGDAPAVEGHTYIVKTFDFGQEEGLYYLALEWVDGEPLADFASRSGQLAPPLVATIIEQVGAALAATHSRNIIHRDLKPANIMFDPATQQAKLLDFGIARDAETSADERLTRAGFFVGTLQYVAPETLSGALVDEQADVYSLATIAYYLLTGTHPFPGKNPRELFQQLLTQNPVPLNQAEKGLKFTPAVEAAVMRGLERDLAKRAKTVDDFSREFCTAVRETDDQKGGGFLKRLFGK